MGALPIGEWCRARTISLALALAPLAAGAQAPPPAIPNVSPGASFPVEPTLPDDLPKEAPAELFPIPPAVERPLDVDEGERLFVKRFELKGVSDRPRQGVSRTDIQDIVEEMRVKQLGLNKVGDDGFTSAEREQITAFMRGVVEDPDRGLQVEAYQDLIDRLRTERASRAAGMTIGQIQQVANAVTTYYRGRGFILAEAFVPAQEVGDGVVVIEVLEGTLGKVDVEGNEDYVSEVLAKPFQDLIDAPVTAKEVEAAILTVNDYPGVDAFGVFQPGTELGETDLALRVQEEKRFEFSVRYDNWGTRFTGQDRFWVDAAWNNPTGAGDRLYGAFLQQVDPTNGSFWQFEYQRPIGPPGMTVGAGYQRNPFDVGSTLGALGLTGESEIARVFLRKSLVRSREKNVFLNLGWHYSDAVTKAQGQKISEDELSVLEPSLDFELIDSRYRGINLGRIGMGIGLGDLLWGKGEDEVRASQVPPSRIGAGGQVGSNDFVKFFGSASRLQQLGDHSSLLIRADAQGSPDLLTSLEQFRIGGPGSVRAFPVSEALTDSGLFGSAELFFNAPGFATKPAFWGLTWGEVVRLSLFTDFAWGELNEPLISDLKTQTFAGYGAGLSFDVPGRFQGRIQYAEPFGSKVASDGDSSRWWVDFTFRF